MFKIIDLYVFGRVGRALIIATTFLTLFVMLSTLIGELGLRGSQYFLHQMLQLVPFIIYDMLPLGCVIGVVIAVQSMINNNELVIIKELGSGGMRIICLITIPALIAGIFAYLWIDFVAVPLHKMAGEKLDKQEESIRGLWLHDDKRLFYIDRLSLTPAGATDQQIATGEARVFEFKDASSSSSSISYLSSYQRATSIKFYAEREAVADRLLSWQDDATQVTTSVTTNTPYPLTLNPRTLIGSLQDKKSQNVYNLWQGSKTSRSYGAASQARSYEIWDRISKPLLFVSLALLMLALCLATPPRSSLVLQVVISIAVGIFIGTIFRAISLYVAVANESYLWLGSLAPPIVLSVIATLFILRRV